MTEFTIHTLESAPEKSKSCLEKSIKGFGSIPNLHGIMAEAPGLLEGYQILHALFVRSSFNKAEMTVVWQTINVEHGCECCVPAHTAIAHMMKVDPELTEALRNKDRMPTRELQILHETVLAMVRKRGRLSDDDMNTFFEAGFSKRQLLDIILCLSSKVMTNYVNHIARTPLDEAFEPYAWESEPQN